MVLVTGATGILGRVIVLELLKQGKQVRATKRSNSNLEEVKNSYQYYTENAEEWFAKIEWIDVDFFNAENLEKVLRDIDEIYHTAAKVSFHPDDKKEMYRTNIDATRELLFACENTSVKKLCFISSIAVLDGLNENREMDENSDYNCKLNHSAYAKSKHFSEMEVWRASAEGLNTVIVNPGMIIGTGNWHQSSGELFSTFEKNSYTFSGGTSYVDVRDVARISVELMEKNVFAKRFILISENLKYKNFGCEIRTILGLKPLKILPKYVLNTGVWLNKFLGWMFPKLKIMNTINIESVSTFNNISNKKITETLNYKFIPVKESICFHLNNYIKDKNSKKL